MQNKIQTDVGWSIKLDNLDQFKLTGTETFVNTEYTILVEKVCDVECVIDRKRVQGLRFIGRRVLKSGKGSYQTKRVDLPDGHELIPAEIAEQAALLRAKVASLQALLDQHS